MRALIPTVFVLSVASCSDAKRADLARPSASAAVAPVSASAPVASSSAAVPVPRVAPRLLPPLDGGHLRAWVREAEERNPDDGVVTSPPERGSELWVSWPLPLAGPPPRLYSVITCRYLPGAKDDADAHVHGLCRVWTVDFGTHEWASAPLDLPTRPRDLGAMKPIDSDAEREIGFLLADTGSAFHDTLAGWPPASRGWDSARGNAHRLGELLARSLTPEMMRLYWEADGRFFRWVETAAELDVMGRGGRFRPCAKRPPETFDRDGLAPLPIALSVPTRRDTCLRLTRPLMNDSANDGPPAWVLPPRFILDLDPESMAVTSMTTLDAWLRVRATPGTVEKHDGHGVEAKLVAELPHVMSLFLRRGPLSGDERDDVLAYEVDLFTLVDRGLEPTYRAIAPDFFKWIDEVRSGARTPL